MHNRTLFFFHYRAFLIKEMNFLFMVINWEHKSERKNEPESSRNEETVPHYLTVKKKKKEIKQSTSEQQALNSHFEGMA